MNTYTTFKCPLNTLLLTANDTGLTGLYLNSDAPDLQLNGTPCDDLALFVEAKRQLTAYFEGKLTQFDLPLAPDGTEFQQRVWAELQNIPFGETISYGELARRIGNPNASRAVGLANGRNPLSIIIPCHRVIGANGKLTGYSGGLSRKERLLQLEAEVLAKSAKAGEKRGV
jgi:methylated-DNA-[protein]-cysteine S-methyltransferase